MPVVMLMELPGVTTAQYDEINKLMGVNGPEDEPAGLISHVCAKTDEGLLICDVWRSQAELDDFSASQVGPAAEKVGAVPKPPRLAELHYQFHR
jgi:hypothetical protein